MPRSLLQIFRSARVAFGLVLSAAFALAPVAHAQVQVRSAPGAVYAPIKAEPVVRPFVAASMPSRDIRLLEPTAAEPTAMTKSDLRVTKNRPLRIGFDRTPLQNDRRIELPTLPWRSQPDGALAAQMRITSAGAASVRVHLQAADIGDDLEARVLGTHGNTQIFAASGADFMRPDGYWSPVLDGETAVVQLRLPPGVAPRGHLELLAVGHLVLSASEMKSAQDIGTSERCEVDVACVRGSSPAAGNAANAVAQTILSIGFSEILCTGTLLNTTPQTNIPYLLTAYHCYDADKTSTEQQVQARASTMTTLWFFEALSCGSNVPAAYVQVAGGATFLYRGPDIDVILLRLNASPPAGAWFAGWEATPVPTNTPAIVVHHPEGDLKKISAGTTQAYTDFDGAGSYISMRYQSGATELGSSGSPLFTCSAASNGACSEYSVRGALTGGDADCSFPAGTDQYSRLDLAYPYIAQYLTPNVVLPTGNGTAVEFYNVNLDHFFMTTNGTEQVGIDNGSAGPGWFRTGFGFNTLPPGHGMQVCRFYGSVSPGPNSHFYTLDPIECQHLKDLQAIQPATQPRWNFEGIAFWNVLPASGACPIGTMPIYRFYNNGFPVKDSNHRYVTSLASMQFMIDQGWTLEGVAMCAPQ
jgi:hypothetical protein